MVRMENDGQRVMAAAMKDLDPSSFDPWVTCWRT